MRGAANRAFLQPPVSNTRRVVTLPLLTLIGHRIAATSWSPVSKQVVWAACTLAFFTASRLGELLASTTHSFDPTADLLWEDVKFLPNESLLVRLKCAKSADIQGEFLDVFPFPGYDCFPIATMLYLKKLHMEAGLFDLKKPVFRFAAKNLTTSHFNNILASLLPDFCRPGQDTITCHSFRPGIPSTLALFPDLANTDDIQGWGRWHSDCFNRYTRLRHDQKRAIFDKIKTALVTAYNFGR